MHPKQLGKYEILRPLGRGGMGMVYLARDPALRRDVAIKVILPEQGSQEALLKRFEREVRVCANLSHPNLIRIYDYGQTEGRHWFAMEFVKGRSIEEVLAERRLSVDEVERLCEQIGSALLTMHEGDVLHRDIKPANIMMGDDGRFVLMDFGLAKTSDSTQLTKTGRAVGTPLFMSPEMLFARPVGPASDVYQFGIVLYWGLAGGLPQHMTRKGIEGLVDFLVRGHMPSLTNALPELSPHLDQLVLNTVAFSEEKRYPGLKPFLDDFERYRQGEAVLPWGDGLPAGDSGDEITEEIPVNEGVHGADGGGPDELSRSGARARGGSGVHRRSSGGVRRPSGALRGPRSGGFSAPPEGAFSSASGSLSSSAIMIAQEAPRKWAAVCVALAVILVLGALAWSHFAVKAPPDVTVERLDIVPGVRCARVRWATRRAVPSALKLARIGREQLASQIFREDLVRREHDMLVPSLEGGVDYRLSVLFPDGQSSLARSLRVADELRFEGPTSERDETGRLVLVWTSKVPARCDLRYVRAGKAATLAGSEDWVKEHRFVVDGVDPMEDLTDVSLRGRDVSGKERVEPPTRVPGLPGRFLQALDAAGVETFRAELPRQLDGLRRDRSEGMAGEAARAFLERLGLYAPWRALQPRLKKYMAEAPLADRIRLHRGLGELCLVDQLCRHYRHEAPLQVEAYFESFVATSRRPWIGSEEGTGITSLTMPPFKDLFFPVNCSDRDMERRVAAVRVLLPVDRMPYRSYRHDFVCDRGELASSREAQLYLQVGQFYSNYYFLVEINDGLRMVMLNPNVEDDPGVVFNRSITNPLGGDDGSPKTEANTLRSYYLRFPLACLRPGPNHVTLTLHTLTTAEGLITNLRNLQVKVR